MRAIHMTLLKELHRESQPEISTQYGALSLHWA
ncbi:MAG: hypothetical protein ACI97A_004164, partial [Planctomycetota bacterium]